MKGTLQGIILATGYLVELIRDYRAMPRVWDVRLGVIGSYRARWQQRIMPSDWTERTAHLYVPTARAVERIDSLEPAHVEAILWCADRAETYTVLASYLRAFPRTLDELRRHDS